MKSPKELSLDSKLIEKIKGFAPAGKAIETVKLLLSDDEIQALQEYANVVSIKRLGYNDHGPVHMRMVAMNALVMMDLLRKAVVKMNLEAEECGGFEDSLIAVFTASFLHDIGISVGRQDHELHSTYQAYPILDRIFKSVYGDDVQKRVIVRALALECISGHMGNRQIHSLEAGIIQVADGCDMQKGRARISMALAERPRVGDIHQYSANSIEAVRIQEGKERPIRIDVAMSSEVGLFQIEEVLLQKIAASTAKGCIELYALVHGEERKRYL
jgi:metal-dependent HD superfamily phosphatase/phosphodiesterase